MSMGVYSPTCGVPYLIVRYAKGMIYIHAWALCCSFNYSGHYQSLRAWDG